MKPAPKPAFRTDRDENLLRWIRTQPCVFCQLEGRTQTDHTEVEHLQSVGSGGGDHNNAVPGCAYHRQLRHTKGLSALVLICRNAKTSFGKIVGNVERDYASAWERLNAHGEWNGSR